MKPITYRSRDGLTINGYLTLPLGVDPKNLPVVVHPHGGPWARDGWALIRLYNSSRTGIRCSSNELQGINRVWKRILGNKL